MGPKEVGYRGSQAGERRMLLLKWGVLGGKVCKRGAHFGGERFGYHSREMGDSELVRLRG